MMTLRVPLLFCLVAVTTSSTSADLIFSLRPVRLGAPTDGGPITNSPAFIDLVVQSNGSDEFFTFLYEINISPETGAPVGGLFFAPPLINEGVHNSYVFAGDSGFQASALNGSNQSLQGGDITASDNNLLLLNSAGPRLVARVELGLQPGLSDGLRYSVSIDTTRFRVERNNTGGGSANVSFLADDTITFTMGGGTAAVPEPSSIAALLLLAGGVMYRRRKLQS